jgi:hypothetical protein
LAIALATSDAAVGTTATATGALVGVANRGRVGVADDAVVGAGGRAALAAAVSRADFGAAHAAMVNAPATRTVIRSGAAGGRRMTELSALPTGT